MQVLPLAVMTGAACLGERIGTKGWVLAVIGLAGVVLIVRPSAKGLDPWSLCLLLAVLCMAMRDLGTRSLGKRVPSALVPAAARTVFAPPFACSRRQPPPGGPRRSRWWVALASRY